MLDNPVYNDSIVRGYDLQAIVDAVNANELFTDNTTLIANKSEAGTSLSVVDQYGGGGGDTVTSTNPWVITTEIIDEIQHIRIGSGNVYTGEELETATHVPSGALDVSEYVDGDKLLVYTDIPISRLDDELKLVTTPSVIPSTSSPNFRVFKQVSVDDYNSTKNTIDRIYTRVGEIEVKAIEGTSPVELEYIITQILDEHIKLPSLEFKGFSVFGYTNVDIEDQKTTYESYTDVYCTGGTYILPDNTSGRLEQLKAINSFGSYYVFIHVSSTPNATTGGYDNWSAELVSGDYFTSTTESDSYYPIGGTFSYDIYQDFEGSFLSPARIW